MVVQCAIKNCKNKAYRWASQSFHKFPVRDPERNQLWLLAAGVDINTPTETVLKLRMCSDHFRPGDFQKQNNLKGHTLLTTNAVPSVFPDAPTATNEQNTTTPMPRRGRKSSTAKEQWRLRKERKKALNEGDESFDTTGTDVSSDCTSYEEINRTSSTVSHNQSGVSFPDYNTGNQCLASSLMFLAYLQETDDVVGENLDNVLRKGDMLYNQIKHRLEENKSCIRRHLYLDDLPDTVETDEGHYTVVGSIPLSGFLLQEAPEGRDDYLNLSLRLEALGTEYSKALLIVGSLCISVFRDRLGHFGVFHPHSQNANGVYFAGSEKAVVATFDTAADLANELVWYFCNSLQLDVDKDYNLLPVLFNRLASEDQTKARSAMESKQERMPYHSFSQTTQTESCSKSEKTLDETGTKISRGEKRVGERAQHETDAKRER